MSTKFYEPVQMRAATLAIVATANRLLRSYAAQGYRVTLRQLYYQYVAHDLFPDTWIDRTYNKKNGLEPETKNTQKNYKRLGSIIDNGRKCGLIDWDHMVDLGRDCTENSHWDSVLDIVEGCVDQFRYRTWDNQPWHVRVMVEKQALEGVLLPICRTLDIPFSANKGYSSSSAMREAGVELRRELEKGKNICVIYLGDHDPSGLDMARDVKDRLRLYAGYEFYQAKETSGPIYDKALKTKNPRYFKRYRDARFSDQQFLIQHVALSLDQIEQFSCPPNPAKSTDSQFAKYREEFGDESWELDALPVQELARLVREEVAAHRDDFLYEQALERQTWAREQIHGLLAHLPDEPTAEEFNDNPQDYPILGTVTPVHLTDEEFTGEEAAADFEDYKNSSEDFADTDEDDDTEDDFDDVDDTDDE